MAAERGAAVAAEAALYHAPPPHCHAHLLQLPLMRLVDLPSRTHRSHRSSTVSSVCLLGLGVSERVHGRLPDCPGTYLHALLDKRNRHTSQQDFHLILTLYVSWQRLVQSARRLTCASCRQRGKPKYSIKTDIYQWEYFKAWPESTGAI